MNQLRINRSLKKSHFNESKDYRVNRHPRNRGIWRHGVCRQGENENRQKIAMNELPIAVQKTIQDNLGGGTVTETVKETKGGKTYYEAEVQKSGGEKVEIKVTEDGKLIGVGKEDDDD